MDYASNSNKSKEAAPEETTEVTETKVITKVVTTTGVVKRKTIGKKLKGIFFGGDFKAAAKYVFADVLLPAARDMLFDSLNEGAKRVVYGERGPRGGRRASQDYRGYVQYNTPVRRSRSAMLPDQAPRMQQRVGRRESSDVLIASREEANLVLQTMIDCVDKYEQISVADLNELIGVQSANVDHRWGWTNLNQASIRQVRDGYMLELPPMEEL